jgi:SAM-dependent methyltransferase
MDAARLWGSADYTHRLGEVSWMGSTAVLMHLNERATGDPARDWLSSWAHRFFVGQDLRVLVLGCGEGWLERAVSEWPFVSRIDALDFAEAAVARARERGGLKICYSVADLNRDALEAGAYDVVVAHSILHHVEQLEHAFEQIERAMKPEATFIVNEYIGPNRFQFSDKILAIINDLLRCLPPQLRHSALEDRVYEARERPTIEQMISNDPSEAVRASDLMPMIRQRFDVLEVKQLGGTILMHLLYDIVQNFRFDDPHERGAIELLCALEGALVDRGSISSDFAILAARRKSARTPKSAYCRPLPPRPEASKDLETDPLGFGPRRPAARGQWEALQPWMLRVLRVVLASSRPGRANLIDERRLNAFIEQLRCAASRAAPFEWITARWSAHDDDATIAALLVAMERIAARHGLLGAR